MSIDSARAARPSITIDRVGSSFRLTAEQWIPRPRDVVFPFFADAFNLEQITPSTLRFEILTPPPIAMQVGARIEYRLRIRGVPVRWETEITAWQPPGRFVDEQRRGPYRFWRHTHTFEPVNGPGGEGTIMRDRVEYAVRFGWLVHGILVAPDLRRIFATRHRRVAAHFASPAASGVTGATGVSANDRTAGPDLEECPS